MHIAKHEDFCIGIGWYSKEMYGEGGFWIHIGHTMICFWKKQ